MASLNPATIGILIALPFIGWRLYVRFRRLVGRQKLSRVRPWLTVTIFPVMLALVGWLATLERLGWLAGGVLAGALLGVYALRSTRFEATPEGLYYTPNAHLGIALSLLILARVGYRMFEVVSAEPHMVRNNAQFVQSPLTLVLLGLLGGYYVAYAAGLIRWRRRVLQQQIVD
jgi:hypothetical protein